MRIYVVIMINKAAKDLAGKKTAVASEIVPPSGADHEKSDCDSEFEPSRSSDHEKSDSDSAAETDSTYIDVLRLPWTPSSW